MEIAGDLLSAQAFTMTSSKEFTDLYERHHAAVYRAALRVTGNPADAEDVLQTVFVRVLNRGVSLEDIPAPEPYFRRAAINAGLDIVRRRASHGEIELEAAATAAKDNTEFLKQRLRRAISSLDSEDAALFLLRFVEGMSNGELAQMFGQAKNNIAVRLHRIRQTLQAEMER